MQPIQQPVTGNETQELNTPLGALTAFYRAFNRRDMSEMRQVWLSGDEPSMDNPVGGIRRGWPEIEAGYRRLFDGDAGVYVEFHDYTLQQGSDFALAVGRERGSCETAAGKIELAIRTSRLFVLRDGRWLQMHHHGSMENGPLLVAYQRAILGQAIGYPK